MKSFSYRKLIAGCVGFVAGIVSSPIMLFVIPFFFAWFIYNEEEG